MHEVCKMVADVRNMRCRATWLGYVNGDCAGLEKGFLCATQHVTRSAGCHGPKVPSEIVRLERRRQRRKKKSIGKKRQY